MKKFTEKFGKIIIPLLTPYDEFEAVDYKQYAALVEYIISNDLCDTLLVTGTTGEASLLTLEERAELVRTAVKASAGRKPVVAGTGCASTRETVQMTNMAVRAGVDTVMVVAPFYNKPTQEGLYQHYKTVAESTTADVILYNIPIFTGVNIAPATLHELAKIHNIIGIKDESGINPTQITDYFMAVEEINPEFAVFNGDDIMLLPTIIQGAMGIISGGAAIFGHEIREIFRAFEAGENERACEINRGLYRFCKTLGQGGRTLPNSLLRPAVEAVSGVKIGPGRSPITKPTDEEWQITYNVLKELKKL
jgi:4-hydroxy-tetrahydrodipicolinate synthase